MSCPPPSDQAQFRVTCAPGLEALLDRELCDLGFAVERVGRGGVVLSSPERSLPQLHRSRLASRVWMRLAEVPAGDLGALCRAAEGTDWFLYGGDDETMGLALNGVPADALAPLWEALPPRCAAGEGAVQLKLRADDERWSLEVDCSGAGMHERGYAMDPTDVPLEENFAVACLQAAGWRVGEPLVDPCCGPGSFVIEAALMAKPSSRLRPWRFEAWPGRRWEAVDGPDQASGFLLASDRAYAAYDACRDHAARAGVLDRIDLRRSSLEELNLLDLPDSGLVIAHPPYDAAQRGRVLRLLLARFHGPFKAWRLGLLLPRTAPCPHAALQPVLHFRHGERWVQLWLGRPGA